VTGRAPWRRALVAGVGAVSVAAVTGAAAPARSAHGRQEQDQQAGYAGRWALGPASTPGAVQLTLMNWEGNGNSLASRRVAVAALDGLPAGGRGPARFALQRAAGTFTFEGAIASGRGAGTFAFAPDPRFGADLARRGVGQPTGAQQLRLAFHDVDAGFVDALARLGYARPTLEELARATDGPGLLAYAAAIAPLDVRPRTLPALVALRDHGVTVDVIRRANARAGRRLPAEALVALRRAGEA
jgi:hypothetical protein